MKDDAQMTLFSRWTPDLIEAALEDAMERVASWPIRKRRATLEPFNPSRARRGVIVVGLAPSQFEGTIEQYADVLACAAFEPGGVWVTGINFHAAPGGCQGCCLANWEGDRVTGCAWEWEPEESKVVESHGIKTRPNLAFQRAWRAKWTFAEPPAWLEYCRERDAIDEDGHVDGDEIIRQCPGYDPLDEDE